MTSEYRDQFYSSYVTGHQGEVVEAGSAPAFLADIIARLPHDDLGAAILDVGCGQGQIMRLAATSGFRNVSGIDLSPEQVDLAKRLGTERVEEGDLFTYSTEHAGQFDAVIAVDLVEHFDRSQVAAVFAALAALLRPGGRLILRTPNGSSPYAGRILYSDMTHGVAYTARSLKQIAATSGFSSVTAYPVRPSGGGAKQRVRRALWRLIEFVLVIPLIVETGQVRGHLVTQNLVAVLRR